MSEPISKKQERLPSSPFLTIVYPLIVLLAMFVGTGAFSEEEQGESPHQKLLYLLLVAEMAGNRQEGQLALQDYLKAATMSTDPEVAEAATRMAIELQAPKEATEAAEIWAKLAKDNLQAQLVATTLLIGQSVERALPYLETALDINASELSQNIIAIQSRLSETSSKNLNEALKRIALKRPKDPYAQLISAQSAADKSEIEVAKKAVNAALTLNPGLTPALQLKARLIRYEDDNDKAALQFLAEKVKKFDSNAELRLFYASALMDSKNFEEAKKQLIKISNDKTFGGQALLFLGEIYYNEKKFNDSKTQFKKAIEFPQTRDSARYMLGQVTENIGEKEEAIGLFSGITEGPYHVPAFIRAANILKSKQSFDEAIYLLHEANATTEEEQKLLFFTEIEILFANKKADEAMAQLDDILIKRPTDEDVLLVHGMAAAKLKKWEVAESDFKKIITQNPNNANALNALASVVSLDKDRLPEALRYISQALALSPKNPVYLDTMGWINYQMGNLKEASLYLMKARELSDDGLIAAHLGEILWMMNQKQDAMKIWSDALTKYPKQEEVLETLKRLKVNLKPMTSLNISFKHVV